MPLRVLSEPVDRLGRGLDDLRISVIDRCNFRCTFCMPADRDYEFLRRSEILSFEEITRVARLFAELGVRKIRLTGGEPLLRREIEKLVAMLSQIDGIEDLAMTTNGLLLPKKADSLAAAGLDRVTVSLESLDDEIFGRINGRGVAVSSVVAGLEAAQSAGLDPIKVNVVVMKGVNDHELVDLAAFCKQRGWVARFIEFMDVGTLNEWRLDRVVTAREIVERIAAVFPVEPVERRRASDVAERYRYLDDGVELGIIASITQPFCGDCSRARLSSEGQLYTCLFAAEGLDLKQALRTGVADDELAAMIRRRWSVRDDRYSEIRAETMRSGRRSPVDRIEMFRIGG